MWQGPKSVDDSIYNMSRLTTKKNPFYFLKKRRKMSTKHFSLFYFSRIKKFNFFLSLGFSQGEKNNLIFQIKYISLVAKKHCSILLFAFNIFLKKLSPNSDISFLKLGYVDNQLPNQAFR